MHSMVRECESYRIKQKIRINIQKSYSQSEKKMSSKTILHHVVTVHIIEDTAALDTSRLSQAAFKNAYAQYAAIAKELDGYDMPLTDKLVWRTQRVEDLVDKALKRYGMRVARSKTAMESLNSNKGYLALHMTLEEAQGD
nr:MAG TPA: hypothetical protein [Caudoviricetes sp.]